MPNSFNNRHHFGSPMIKINTSVRHKSTFIQSISFFFFSSLQVHSWWPWRSSLGEGKCVLRTQDGWLKRPCDEQQAFICERDIHRQLIPLTVRCGNAQTTLSSTIITITTTTAIPIIPTSTLHPTVSFIQPPVEHEDIPSPVYKQHLFVPAISPSINTEQPKTTIETKTNSIDPSKINQSFSFFI